MSMMVMMIKIRILLGICFIFYHLCIKYLFSLTSYIVMYYFVLAHHSVRCKPLFCTILCQKMMVVMIMVSTKTGLIQARCGCGVWRRVTSWTSV